ncbi:MAG: hypothetical protein K6E18_09090 [Lachnospiraceae bacterium]|nr:hypothetical protein [Lachnospiraceae bacterium]
MNAKKERVGKHNFIKGKSLCRRLEALALSLVLTVGYISFPDSRIRVLAADTEDETIYYEWTAVNDVVGTFNKAKNTKIRTMIVWNRDGIKYISGESFNRRWYGVQSVADDRQMEWLEQKWLTDNGRGAPYFVTNNTLDKDNDYYPQVTIYQGRTDVNMVNKAGNTYPVYTEVMTRRRITSDDDYLDMKTEGHNNVTGVQWTVEGRGDSGGHKGCNIFQNVSGRDPVFKTNGDNLSAEYETREGKREWFYFYTGKEVPFNIYPAGIHCYSGQVTSLKKNSVLPEKTVTKVEEGAVLVVNSTTFLNGKIEVDGGTLLVQDGATLMAYSRQSSQTGTACVEVKNGGAFIVMNKGRVILCQTDPSALNVVQQGQIKLTEGGKLYNFGTTFCNRLIANSSAEIENRAGAVLYAGYQLTDLGMLRAYYNNNWLAYRSPNKNSLISASESGAASMKAEGVRIVNKGTIYTPHVEESQNNDSKKMTIVSSVINGVLSNSQFTSIEDAVEGNAVKH